MENFNVITAEGNNKTVIMTTFPYGKTHYGRLAKFMDFIEIIMSDLRDYENREYDYVYDGEFFTSIECDIFEDLEKNHHLYEVRFIQKTGNTLASFNIQQNTDMWKSATAKSEVMQILKGNIFRVKRSAYKSITKKRAPKA